MNFLTQIGGSIQELIGWFDTRINRYKNNETPLKTKKTNIQKTKTEKPQKEMKKNNIIKQINIQK